MVDAPAPKAKLRRRAAALVPPGPLAPGTLEVEGNRQIVQHPSGGVIDSIAYIVFFFPGIALLIYSVVGLTLFGVFLSSVRSYDPVTEARGRARACGTR
jgi:hypothetical protein